MSQPTNQFFDKVQHWVKSSISLKLLTIGILILILQIPLSMVKSLVSERQYRKEEVAREISSLWGGANTVGAFMISIPYWKHETIVERDGDRLEQRTVKTKSYAHFLPEEVKINGIVDPEIRHRSIYDVAVYSLKLSIEANFEKPDLLSLGIEDQDIIWRESHLILGISELKGIDDPGNIVIDGSSYAFDPGVPSKQVFSSGIHSYFELDREKETIGVSFDLKLKGSNNLSFLPLGEKTWVSLSSPWKDPSFAGQFIPNDYEIGSDGFIANWNISHLNRNFPQAFIGDYSGTEHARFGVDFIMSVDDYQQLHRASKYGILFISLNFLLYFFIQILKQVKIHSIQYLLVGMSICVFFLLLISTTEHIGFTPAYWISCTASALMIGLYSLSVLKQMQFAIIILTTLFSFFGYMYVAIQLQDFSLLFGSIGLFVILAFVMYFSRRIHWNTQNAIRTPVVPS